MRYGILIVIITAFFMYNTYYDNEISKYVKKNIKYLKMVGIMFSGLSAYLFLRKHPNESRSMLQHGVGIIQYLPIDKHSKDLLTPILNFTEEHKGVIRPTRNQNSSQQYKRSVSETKKKYVASSQNWTCNHGNEQLEATFEVDHIIELQNGGSNETNNLVALCRNCHGKKTMLQRL